MGFVCRPILMFNEYVPAITGTREWKYQVLGHHDGMDVKAPLYMDTTESFQRIFNQYIAEDEPRDYAVQVYFGFHDDDGREVAFWEQKAAFTFVVFIQFREKEISKYNQDLEERKDTGSSGLDIRAYYTLDYNDSILVIKCDSYKIGMEFIAQLHETVNGSFEISSSYTILAFDRKQIGKADCAGANDIIEKVELRIIERFQGSVALLYEKLEEALNPWSQVRLRRYMLFGTDDEAIVIEQIPCNVFFQLYADETGILCNSNETAQRYASAITTKILFELNNSISHTNRSEDNKGSRNYCNELSEFIKLCYENERSKFKLAEKDTLLKITNALGKIEYARNKNGKISEYNFFTLFLPFYNFVMLHTKENACTDEYFEFLTYFNICTQNYDKPDRLFMQTADFNIRYFEMQTKYITLYNAYIHLLKKALNQSETSRYEFILCPGKSERTEVHEFYKKGDNALRLYEVDMAETRMYDIKAMLCVLGHEVAHYVGTDIRSRKIRYEHMLKINSRAIIIAFQNGFRKAGYGDEVCSIKLWEAYEEKFANWIKMYIEREENEKYWEQILGKEGFLQKKQDIEKRYIEGITQYKHYTDEMEFSFGKAIKDMLRLQGEDIFENIIWELFQRKVNGEQIGYGDKNSYLNQCRSELRNVIGMFTCETEDMARFFNITDVLDTELFLLKECYADLVSVLLLHLTLEEYLCTIVDEALNIGYEIARLKDTNVVARIAIVMSVMNYQDQNSNDKKYFVWTNDDIVTDIKKADIMMVQKDALEFQWEYIATDILQAPEYDVYDSASIFYDYKVLREIIAYLLHCREEFYKLVDEGKAKEILQFKAVAEHKDISHFYMDVMDWIVRYESDIYTELSKTADDINQKIQEVKRNGAGNNTI